MATRWFFFFFLMMHGIKQAKAPKVLYRYKRPCCSGQKQVFAVKYIFVDVSKCLRYQTGLARVASYLVQVYIYL